jgi:hypothetical protein
MNAKQAKPDIGQVFLDGHLIDQAVRESVQKALREHKRAQNPVAEWRNGKVVLVKPEAIPA